MDPSPTSLKLDPRTYDRALACVHCGLCLPACPTYLQTGHEAQGPRGRIDLMRGLSDGRVAPTAMVRHHLDACLDCRGCETACPSGVVYHELIEQTRQRLEAYSRQHPSPSTDSQGVLRWIARHVLTHPTRLKLAVLPVRLLQRAGIYEWLRRLRVFDLLPPSLRQLERMLPAAGPLWPPSLPEHSGASGFDALVNVLSNSPARPAAPAKPRLSIGLFAGCMGSVVCDQVNRQAIALLTASGADVHCPGQQVCCGAIHVHGGAADQARELARRNIDLFLNNGRHLDFIVTTIAGCGAMLHEYDLLLRDDAAYRERAAQFVHKVRDISQLLCELPLPPLRHAVDLTVTYHDACHLAHAQKVTAAPRALLGRIRGLRIVPLAQSDLCCGAAGTYNLTHPQMAAELADRKLDNIAASGAEVCVSGNPGCTLHLAARARQRGQDLRIVHPVQLVYQAVFGSGPVRETFV